jgi:phosphatidylinositol kinase/protein kinase (PI-3  family)
VLQGFLAARKHMGSIASVIEVMIPGSQLPCLQDKEVFDEFTERFQLGLTEEKLVEHVDALMTASLDSARTVLYDRFQYYSNGIRE